MKKLLAIVIWGYFITTQPSIGQTANQLVRLHNLTSADMQNISNPLEGSLVYRINSNEPYKFTGTSWEPVNDDGWGVSGEDIFSSVWRYGKVTIGETGGTDIKLMIRGQLKVSSLPDPDDGTRAVAYYDNGINEGLFLSDKYTSRYYMDSLDLSWVDLNFVKLGVIVTGHYEAPDGCSKGHFQFRYQKNESPLYNLNYNAGNGDFNYYPSTEIYEISKDEMPCGEYAVEFKVENDRLKIRRGETSFLNMSIRIEAY